MDIWSAFVLLFLIMDPLGNVPLFLSILKVVPEQRRMRVLVRELLIALGVLAAFLVAGMHMLNLLGLRAESISIAGGIVLFLIAVKMIFPNTRGEYEDKFEEEPLVVPLAIPLIAGPSTLAALLLLTSREPNRMVEWGLALLAAWLATAAILLSATKLRRLLGERGLTAMERLMGMILVALSVQMFLDGLAAYPGIGDS